MSPLIPLRPHHSLCIQFFIGEGYSPAFTEHLTQLIDRFRADNPLIILTEGCDIVCSRCPHNRNGICENDEKVADIDNRSIRAAGLFPGAVLRWSELQHTMYEAVIQSGKLPDICRSCSWQDICLSLPADQWLR